MALQVALIATCSNEGNLSCSILNFGNFGCFGYPQGDATIFRDVYESVLGFMEESLKDMLEGCYDAIGLLLMIRINYEHQLIMQKRCASPRPRPPFGCSSEPRFESEALRSLSASDIVPSVKLRMRSEHCASLPTFLGRFIGVDMNGVGRAGIADLKAAIQAQSEAIAAPLWWPPI
eukprot:2001546-Pyramimonas_sp.AAC.1